MYKYYYVKKNSREAIPLVISNRITIQLQSKLSRTYDGSTHQNRLACFADIANGLYLNDNLVGPAFN